MTNPETSSDLVKRLEWVDGDEVSDARGYRIERGADDGLFYVRSNEASGMFVTIEFADTLDEAKAAAQSDYDQRILTAIGATTIERLTTALTKISAIRDSIIGFQNVGWSEHIYPLVAALHEAGFDGIGYDEARKNVQATLDAKKAMEDRLAAAESLNARQGEALKRLVDAVGNMRVPQNAAEAGVQVTLTLGPALTAARAALNQENGNG